MQRGERAKWRKLAALCEEVAESKNYEEEYIAKIKVRRDLAKIIQLNLNQSD